MTYLIFGALLVLLAAQRWDHGRQLQAERAHSHKLLDNVRDLTNQIVLLKVAPTQAAAAVVAEPTVELPPVPVDDSPYADEMWNLHLEELKG